ncbi:MAG: major facilitator superfamily permease [Candidatus Magnetoglobus multicellularis str. Araruama]|uniref:Major facilitator superfamily permease n=1 Tax=Candidatus Magnetoglobus multicellularis str. Araruama TaxID=890399 RepID=A0A1V1P880_9BACT|nr:MAG: major facilitator superfamily permease [Candidatus Magnetoglobus multicellularis str. Araruama]
MIYCLFYDDDGVKKVLCSLPDVIKAKENMDNTKNKTAIPAILKLILKKLWGSFKDLLPIILVIAFFQIIVIRQPLPNIVEVVFGGILVVLGLMIFVQGLEMGLFPIGEAMAQALARKGSLLWLLIFAFLLGFSTTVAEPALIAVSAEAAEIAARAGLISSSQESMKSYALGLRLSVAFSVGIAILIGVLRILRGWPIHYLIICGYVVVMLMTLIAPQEIIGIAYDAGGVTTSTVTVPLVAALGVGLATIIKGRSPLLDGFGLIAFASLMPMIFVMGYGLIVFK